MVQQSETLSGSRKRALYLGDDGKMFQSISQALTLLYDLQREDLRASHRPPLTPDLVLIKATGPDALAAIAMIPAVRDGVGAAPIFVLIDSRDGDLLLAASKQGVQGFIEMPGDLANILAIIHKEQQRSEGSFAGRVASFFSLKGGVGTTTLAVNVAEQLAIHTGGSAILLDLNMPLGDSSLYINHEGKESYSLNDFILNINRFDDKLMEDAIARHDSGLRYLGLPQNLEELESITDVNIKMVITVLRRYYNYVIVDCASDLSPATLACLDDSQAIMLVGEPSLSSMRAVRIAYDTCRQLGYPAERLQLILNRVRSQGDEIVGELLAALQIPVAAQVENNYLTFLEALQQGQLLHDFAPRSVANQQIKDIAALLLPEGAEPGQGAGPRAARGGSWLSSLFRRRAPQLAEEVSP
ncbi:MAG: AAA family ATPase [Thermodesulfobacteriota bacterium]